MQRPAGAGVYEVVARREQVVMSWVDHLPIVQAIPFTSSLDNPFIPGAERSLNA
jgi:hypothetical protein